MHISFSEGYPDGNFSVTDDMNVEPNVSKSITLKVLDISLPYGVIRNENGEADIIIVDNDCKHLKYHIAGYTQGYYYRAITKIQN